MDPSSSDNQVETLKNLLNQADLPADLKTRLSSKLDHLEKLISQVGFKLEFDKDLKQIEFIASLPFNKSSTDILDLSHAKSILTKNHHGLEPVKNRILEYLSVLILNRKAAKKSPPSALTFVGLVGSGKTSLAYSLASALGRQIIRIPFGGLGSVSELRGKSALSIDGEPGKLMKQIQSVGVNNPVVLLDEIDRVAVENRNDVMGVLIELLDPEQNFAFGDYYVDYPFDLSGALFIATANNLTNVANAVLDRLEIVEMPSYTDQEKTIIAKDYLMPKILSESGMNPEMVKIDEGLWPQIIRPLGFDGGIRSLQRHLQTVVRRVAREVVEGNPGPYLLNSDNIGKYLE